MGIIQLNTEKTFLSFYHYCTRINTNSEVHLPDQRLSRHLKDLPSSNNWKALLMSEKGILCVMKPSKLILTS